MMGGLLAGMTEATGAGAYFYHEGKWVKAYREMGSLEPVERGKPSSQVNGKLSSDKHDAKPKSAP